MTESYKGDVKKLREIRENLQSIFCDPEGNVSFRGSEGDMKIFETVLNNLDGILGSGSKKEKQKYLAIIHLASLKSQVLSFTTYMVQDNEWGQALSGKEATELLGDFGVSNVKDLNGMLCWVKRKGETMIYAGYCKLNQMKEEAGNGGN